ncbi:MAG: glycosyltransferase [Leptospirales bacterium]
MEQPLVSVVMPCYNHEKYVEQSILSVIRQPYKNVELIAIDDGSKDCTPEIVKRLAEKYDFYFELQQTNKGICHTLNKGIGLAKGRYIKFLASDDFLHDQSITEFVAAMENDPKIDACFGDLNEVDKDGNYIRCLKSGVSRLFESKFKVDSIADISPDMAIQVSPMIGSAYMIRKSVLDEFGRFNETLIVEDWDLFMYLVCHSKKISCIPAVAAYYRTIGLAERPVRRDNKRWFLSDFRIITKYKDHVSRKSFEIATKNIVRFHTKIAIECNESPSYLLWHVKKHLFLLSLFKDFKFLTKIFNFYKKSLITTFRSKFQKQFLSS